MSLLLNSLVVLDPTSKYHNLLVNILVSSDGKISKIYRNKINVKARKSIDCQKKKVTLGWMDFNANFCDPGFEYKEDLNSATNLSAKSGFTDVLISPDTNPVIQSKNDIAYIKNKSKNDFCTIHASASITKNSEGKQMNDLIDLHKEGALAFSDNKIENSELILNTLIYLKQFDGLYISRPQEKYLSTGLVNDGINSNILGLKSIPNISETIAIERDLSLVEYSGGKIHFSGISTKESVELIRSAKKKGLNVTCDVPIYNLLFDDSKILDFDTNYKVYPPLRSKDDIKELFNGLNDRGNIQKSLQKIELLNSMQMPQLDLEQKEL